MNRACRRRLLSAFLVLIPLSVSARSPEQTLALSWAITVITILLLFTTGILLWLVLRVRNVLRDRRKGSDRNSLLPQVQDLDENEVSSLLEARKFATKRRNHSYLNRTVLIAIAVFLAAPALGQPVDQATTSLFSQPGIIITIALILIPLFAGVFFLILRVNKLIGQYNLKKMNREADGLAEHLLYDDVDESLIRRKASLEFRLNNNELSGMLPADDTRGVLLKATNTAGPQFVAPKKRSAKRPDIDPRLARLVIWYLGSAILWLVLGTSVGEYLGIKFVSPDIDHQSWLSFGRLRPVHTNAVFWGWSSLAMLGLGYYIVPMVSNAPVASIRRGWTSLWLINGSVFAGTVCLMAGINNGGGEYREYVWPVMALFGAGLLITLVNFIRTIARRTTHEIYISNWYMVAAIIFTLTIAFIAYWPTWQNGLGETIVQGYYMHQGVGMWFMLFTLGIVYYFLPQQLNKPIYSYSLGILAFWTQILFYTVIGTHHFVFSSIPWWLQTVAIVGSMGMVIPVTAGTTNFLMTLRGDWQKVGNSYTLPFFAVGIVFYFTGSFQGTAEAFRFTNLLWHFTDFTVAHSHITMYGIIAFLLWGSMYAVVPRLTGREPSQLFVGIHFWLAFTGLLLYVVPLMIGGTLKGLLWMEGAPFIESVTLMVPYWLWRAIGGSMMWLSHLFFAYNFYRMVAAKDQPDVKKIAFEKIRKINEKEALPAG